MRVLRTPASPFTNARHPNSAGGQSLLMVGRLFLGWHTLLYGRLIRAIIFRPSIHTSLNQHDWIFILLHLQRLDSSERFQRIKMLPLDTSPFHQFHRIIESLNPFVIADHQVSPSKLIDRCTAAKCLERVFLWGWKDTGESGITMASRRVYAGFFRAVAASETNLESEEGESGCRFREDARFGLGDCVRLSAVPRAVVAPQMIASSGPSRHHNRNVRKRMAAVIA